MSGISWILFSVLILPSAWGQTVSSTSVTPRDLNVAESRSLLTKTVLSSSSNLYSPSSEKYTADTSIESSFDYRFKEVNTLRLLIGATKDLTGAREFLVDDGQASYLRKFPIWLENLSGSGRVSVLLPFSKKSRELETKRTALSLGGSFAYELSKLMQGLTLSYGPSFTRNFHQYKTSNNYKSNTAYSIKNLVGLDYQVFEKISLSLVGYSTNAWTYRGSRKNDRFFLEQNMSYQFLPQWEVTVGHNNGGDFFRPNGADSNVSVYDEKSSTVFISVTASL